MATPKFLWIQTRDGSPTLWSNELGESFRSVKGAFTESWVAFIKPALTHLQTQNQNFSQPIAVGEFGLGAGTNWLLWSLAAQRAQIPFEYFAIERELESFHMGRARWAESCDSLREFFPLEEGAEDTLKSEILALKDPRVFASLEEAQAAGLKVHIWFHDPFGFDVNPDGYTPATLEQCATLWSQEILWGGSYACNRHFREALEMLGNLEISVVPTGSSQLKRERLEFVRR